MLNAEQCEYPSDLWHDVLHEQGAEVCAEYLWAHGGIPAIVRVCTGCEA